MRNVLVPSCRLCGATSYRRVISRAADGRMAASGLYQCSGCSAVFADPKAWREGGDELPPTAGPVRPLTPAATSPSPSSSTMGVPLTPSLSTYGLTPRSVRRPAD